MIIISGGQTGVDRAAWDAAIAIGFEQDGWVPKGRKAEDGPIPSKYHCREISQPYYAARTVQNLLNSDATLVLCFGPPSAGTQLTINLCEKHKRPHLVMDLEKENFSEAIKTASAFIRKQRPHRLNIAGPRGSSNPEAYNAAFGFLLKLFQSTS